MEFLYLERLCLLIHMLSVFDTLVITAVPHNFHLAGQQSWLYGAMEGVKRAQTQVGQECIPYVLDQWTTWYDFRDAAEDLRKIARKVETAHQLRRETLAVC